MEKEKVIRKLRYIADQLEQGKAELTMSESNRFPHDNEEFKVGISYKQRPEI